MSLSSSEILGTVRYRLRALVVVAMMPAVLALGRSRIDLADATLASVIGPPGGECCIPFLAADLDGDGRDELVFRLASLAAVPGLEVNAAGIGIVRGPIMNGLAVDLAAAAPDTVLVGPLGLPGSFGQAIAAADLDGDGLKEIIVGCPSCDASGTGGQVFIWKGRSAWPAVLRVSALENDGFIAGPGRGASFGGTLATADWDGQVGSELAVGAPGANGTDGTPRAGAIHIFSGAASTGMWSASDAITRVGGGATLSGIGGMLSHGDLRGDAVEELVSSYVGGLVVLEDPVATPNWELTLDPPTVRVDTESGVGTVACGDLDGDGVRDLVVSEPSGSAVGCAGCGLIHIVTGPLAVASLQLPDDGACTIRGSSVSPGDLGRYLAVDDADGDGTVELLAGHHLAGSEEGRPAAGLLDSFASRPEWPTALVAYTDDAATTMLGPHGASQMGLGGAVIDSSTPGARLMAIHALTPSDRFDSGGLLVACGGSSVFRGNSAVQLEVAEACTSLPWLDDLPVLVPITFYSTTGASELRLRKVTARPELFDGQ